MINKTILHYKILEKLGEGGMGVVYKARDTKLDREVALKFLPASQVGTGDEQQRFQQEAKAAAKLSHANIATVFEINEHEGETFIAMEYVDGETLSEMIEKRPLKIKDALKIAAQIAEGMHAAHEQGIVHRDIKSANVMITAKGAVKIMDFGLAKLSKASMMTKAGTTLGTISYMSPEQTQGEKVDHRSDIWSFGVVLYEMVSGQMPFKGDYESAIIYSIMNEDPEPLTAVRSGVPMKLEEIVNKLLAKEPGERYQNIIELPVDLKKVSVQEASTSKIGSSAISTLQSEKELTVKVKYSYKTVLTVVTAVILTFLLTWFLRPGPAPPSPKPVNRMIIPLPSDAISSHYRSTAMAISPDGSNIVFMAAPMEGFQRLFLKKAGSFRPSELPGTDFGSAPFFSPDGRWIGFFIGRQRELYKILIDGGEPLKIAGFENRGFGGATWGPDNTIVLGIDNVLKRVPESGGKPVALTRTKQAGERHWFPHMLPDGKTVLFTVGRENQEDSLHTNRLALFGLADEDYRVILDEEGYHGVYSATGHILYGRSNRLMGVPFDLHNLRVTGIPSPVLDKVRTHRGTGQMNYALSTEGTIAYVQGPDTDIESRSLHRLDLSGQTTPIVDLNKTYVDAKYSPDGRYICIPVRDDGFNLWIYHVNGGATNQLTYFAEGQSNSDGIRSLHNTSFAWSPDSRSIAFTAFGEDSTVGIYVKRIDGTREAQKIYTMSDEEFFSIETWSRDGDKIAITHRNSGRGRRRGNTSQANSDILFYSFNDDVLKPFLTTPANEGVPSFSDNGEWLAYMSRESGDWEGYVRSVRDVNAGVWKISEGGANDVIWSPDGKKIYYRTGRDLYAVAVTATDQFSKGDPQLVFEDIMPGSRHFDVHPDGKSFLIIKSPEDEAAQEILVIQNFGEELKRLVPVGER